MMHRPVTQHKDEFQPGLEYVPAASDYADPKIRARTPAGAEVGAGTNQSGENIFAIAWYDPYRWGPEPPPVNGPVPSPDAAREVPLPQS